MNTYAHKQRSPLYLLLLVAAAICFISASLIRGDRATQWILLACGALLLFFGLCFIWMFVRDEGDALAIRYGPLPLFRRRIPYARIRSARPGRSSLIDGWGIHYIPGRGTTYNLWGFDCVELQVDNRTVRVGTDDLLRLTDFLKQRIADAQ